MPAQGFRAAAGDVVPCTRCERPIRRRFEADRITGRLVEVVEPCGWCARKRAGVCQRCHVRRVRGKVGHSLWCEPCWPALLSERYRERARRHQNPWKHRGICMDCKAAPVYGKVGWAETCAPCRDERKRQAGYRCYQRRVSDPKGWAREKEHKRAWRQQNRDKVRLQKRRAAIKRGGTSPEWITRWRERVAAGEHVPTPARRNEQGERLCMTPGCDAVMRGRPKKCEACKAGHLPAVEQRAA